MNHIIFAVAMVTSFPFRSTLRGTLFVSLLCLTSACSPLSAAELKQEVFESLENLRAAKAKEIYNHLEETRRAAVSIRTDPEMLAGFEALREARAHTSPPQSTADSARIEARLERAFVDRYSRFYDILFVDPSGFVINSIKKEVDYHTNLAVGRFSGTWLGKAIAAKEKDAFVDFEQYAPSGEPAAFFLVAIGSAAQFAGWFVLQYDINSINHLLAVEGRFGRSGEAYLVNKDRQMLTDSRFFPGSTILKRIVDTPAVETALAKGRGNRIIRDYRGVTVFSSFEAVECLGVTWIVITEIDEQEVLTDHFQEYRERYIGAIANRLKKHPLAEVTSSHDINEVLSAMRVDVGELARSSRGESLTTFGAGPCTVFVAFRPESFAYLAHLSPTDRSFGHSTFTRLFIGDEDTDLVGQISDRISHFEAPPDQIDQIQFVVIATQLDAFDGIIDRLMQMNVWLSQIRLIYNPTADYVNVTFEQSTSTLLVQWVTHTRRQSIARMDDSFPTLDRALRKVIGYTS